MAKKIIKKNGKAKILKSVKEKKVLDKKKIKLNKNIVAKKVAVRKAVVKKVVAKKIVKPKKIVAKKIVVKKKVLAKKKSVSKKMKKRAVAPSGDFAAEALFKAKIKVIGIGGGGGSIVSEIGRSLEKATFVIADTDIRALKKRAGIKYFWFGQDLTHGLGTGVNVELARTAAEAAKEKMGGFFKDQDIIIFVASLGGGLGSGATQVFADVAKEFGGITVGIFTMPFRFEGKNKLRIAQNALKSLRQSLNVSLVIPNEKIFKVIDESTPITNAFSTVNKNLIGSLESLIDLIYNPGVINIDFADLRTILSGRGNTAFLNTIEESGKDKIEKICENIFKNPLLQTTGFDAQKILFNIAGSESLSMFEVEKISSHIAEANPKAKIIFGISKDTKLKNKIKTTILMTGATAGLQIKETVEKPAPVEKMGFTRPEASQQTNEAAKKEIIADKKAVVDKSIPEGKVKRVEKKVKIPKKLANKVKSKPAKKEKKKDAPIDKKEPKNEPVVGFPENAPNRIPVFETPALAIPAVDQKRLDVIQVPAEVNGKKTIRRSGLEIRKAEELQEKKRIAQEKEWEIPAFLRKVKFKG